MTLCPFKIVQEGLWLAQRAIALARYGLELSRREDEPYIWALTNEQIDRLP